jgi:hypothetical protein
MVSWWVSSPEVLRDLIAARVRAEGGQRPAEKASKVDQTTLWHILNPKKKRGVYRPYRIAERNAERLHKWLPPDDREVFKLCCQRPEVRRRRIEYLRRLQRQTGEMPPARSRLADLIPPTREDLRTPRARLRELFYNELRAYDPNPFDRFEQQLETLGLRAKGSAFRSKEERVWLAYERILGPFLDGAASAGIELTWQDLAKTTPTRSKESNLHRFLDLGMRREILLLARRQADRLEHQVAEDYEKEINRRILEMTLLGHGTKEAHK